MSTRTEERAAASYTANASLFGFPDRPVRLSMTYLPAAKRAGRAGLFLGGGLVAAVPLAFVPPHIPWLLGSVGAGLFFATKNWRGEYLVHETDASCPRCGEPLPIKNGARMSFPADVDCFNCHQAVNIHSLEQT